jgi:hypothetical protein
MSGAGFVPRCAVRPVGDGYAAFVNCAEDLNVCAFEGGSILASADCGQQNYRYKSKPTLWSGTQLYRGRDYSNIRSIFFMSRKSRLDCVAKGMNSFSR